MINLITAVAGTNSHKTKARAKASAKPTWQIIHISDQTFIWILRKYEMKQQSKPKQTQTSNNKKGLKLKSS